MKPIASYFRLGSAILILLIIITLPPTFSAPPQSTLLLPPPNTSRGLPLQAAFAHRQTRREFSSQPLTQQVLSDLLWSALGINRPKTNGRTVPSAVNSQEIDLYVALAEGVFLYNPTNHSLKMLSTNDIRVLTGGQAFVKEAPVALIYVANFDRMEKVRKEDREFYAAIDAGFPIQNTYLFCASESLACVVHELDRAPLHNPLSLTSSQRVILAQSVGYPKPVDPPPPPPPPAQP